MNFIPQPKLSELVTTNQSVPINYLLYLFYYSLILIPIFTQLLILNPLFT